MKRKEHRIIFKALCKRFLEILQKELITYHRQRQLNFSFDDHKKESQTVSQLPKTFPVNRKTTKQILNLIFNLLFNCGYKIMKFVHFLLIYENNTTISSTILKILPLLSLQNTNYIPRLFYSYLIMMNDFYYQQFQAFLTLLVH